MANPLEKLRKLKGRSLKEIRERGEQAINARTEQIGLSGKLPSDEEFADLIDKSYFENKKISPESLLVAFHAQGEQSFFQSFADREKTLEIFRQKFGAKGVTASIIDRAERITEGRFDLLGYRDLDFGEDVDWHFEPISKKHSPLKYWKNFDELETGATGDKKIIWELNRHQHFFTLGAAYWLTGEEIYAETFAHHLEGWMRQNPPGVGINWFSSLEVGFRAMSWIWAFRFFKDSSHLSPELFDKSLRYLHLHARHIEKYLSTYYSPNTHLTGEALGLYYLGTQLQFFTRAAHWRKLGAEILLAELDRQILPDGVYFEQTTWYQRYTADFYTQFLILKKLNAASENNEVSTAKLDAKLEKQLDFLMYITRPDGTTPLVGDDDGGRCLPSGESEPDNFRYILATGAALFGRGDYKFVARDLPEETLWLLGAKGVEAFENLAAARPASDSKSFKDGGYFVMRDGWAETDDYLLIDGGNLGALSGGHAHADALAIDLAAGGRTILTDAGTYTYHESAGARDYFRSTAAHNTLVVNEESSSEPGGKFAWQTMAKTRVKHWISEPRFDFFEGAHDGYERFSGAPATHARSILFLKNDYWMMRDFVKASGANDYQLNFHFTPDADPEIEPAANGDFCVVEKSENETGLRLFAFDGGNWRRTESAVSRCYGKRTPAPLLRFESKGTGAQEFFTFLLPMDAADDAPQVFETELAGGRAFVINFRGYQDLLVFADGEQIVRTEFFDTDFRFLWARISAGEASPEEYVLIDGKTFNLGEREIVKRPDKLEFATARRLGSRLNVRTSESIFSLALA